MSLEFESDLRSIYSRSRTADEVSREIAALRDKIAARREAYEKEYERTLHALCEELGISRCVHFLGFQDPVRLFLDALDLYVHPARMEGCGIAIVEAMAAGKAVVATTTGGIPEVVEHGRTGLLVTSDNPEVLSAAVVSLLRDNIRREEMGERGAKLVRQRFDLKASTAAIEQVYHHLLTRTSGT